MNKTTLIASVAVIGAAYVAYVRIHANIIVKRFPDLDPKIVRKAHSIMMKRAYAGAYADLVDSDETMDAIFRAVVQELRFK